MKTFNIHEIFYYDEDSPSCLRWRISPSCFIKEGDIAGSINNVNGVDRHRVMYNKRYYTVARIIYQMFNPEMDISLYVDHFDGNTINNNINNLRLVSVKTNGENRKKNANNSSGKTGVNFHIKSNSWRANWKENGKNKQKSFSCQKYLNAFEEACNYRDLLIAVLNENGSNYTERHGK